MTCSRKAECADGLVAQLGPKLGRNMVHTSTHVQTLQVTQDRFNTLLLPGICLGKKLEPKAAVWPFFLVHFHLNQPQFDEVLAEHVRMDRHYSDTLWRLFFSFICLFFFLCRRHNSSHSSADTVIYVFATSFMESFWLSLSGFRGVCYFHLSKECTLSMFIGDVHFCQLARVWSVVFCYLCGPCFCPKFVFIWFFKVVNGNWKVGMVFVVNYMSCQKL